MNLSFATVLTLVSGIVLVCGVFMRSLDAKSRVWLALAGAFYTVYALWGITRTSGTFYYNAYVLAIPMLGVGYMVFSMMKGKRAPSSQGDLNRWVRPVSPVAAQAVRPDDSDVGMSVAAIVPSDVPPAEIQCINCALVHDGRRPGCPRCGTPRHQSLSKQ